jgi:uncharacterized membrane protein
MSLVMARIGILRVDGVCCMHQAPVDRIKVVRLFPDVDKASDLHVPPMQEADRRPPAWCPGLAGSSATMCGTRMSDARGYRLANIDMLRGLAVVIMALDHTRDYFMVGGEADPMNNPAIGPALFVTRWITHFCAPVFVFLAGTSAGLMAARKTQAALGKFLFTRGAWLIVVEWFVISTAWSFAPWGLLQVGGLTPVVMQVIWVIGAGMIVLAGAQFLGARACLVLGGVILLGHNLLDGIWPATGGVFDTSSPAWTALHAQTGVVAGPFYLAFAYPLLPWVGVMLTGFGTAQVFRDPPARRDARLLVLGAAAIGVFIVLRVGGLYGDPNPWQVQPGALSTIIDILNVTKYPPSLLYLLMTLGPAAVLCAFAERGPEVVRHPLVAFGRAPFSFYVAHLYLIHGLAIVFGVATGFEASQFLTFSFFFPQGYGTGLPGVYAAWLLILVMLYPLCRWVADVKQRRRDWWLSYL